MTRPKSHPSAQNRNARRSEFVHFYDCTYSYVVTELLALTGDLTVAQVAVQTAYTRAWQAWPSVRTMDLPEMWVRVDAARRVARPARTQRLLERGLLERGLVERGLPPVLRVDLDPEDEVLVAGLQRLPAEQRLPLVLHYMAQLTVEEIVDWFGDSVEEVDERLDDAFEALVAALDWRDEVGVDDPQTTPVPDESYEWTAQALEESAKRLQLTIPTPHAASVFRRATVRKVTRRGAPATAAAVAACIGLVAYFSPAPQQAEAAVYAVTPPPTVDAPATVDGDAPSSATPAPTNPATVPTTSAQARATVHRTGTATAPSRAAAAAAASSTTPAAPSTTTSPAGTTTSASAATSTTSAPTSTTTSTSPTSTTTSTTTSTSPTSTSTSTSTSKTTTSKTTTPKTTDSNDSDDTTTHTSPTSTSQTTTSPTGTSDSGTDSTTTRPHKDKHKHKDGGTTTTETDSDDSGATDGSGTVGGGEPAPVLVTPAPVPPDTMSASGSAPSQGTVVVGRATGDDKGGQVVISGYEGYVGQ